MNLVSKSSVSLVLLLALVGCSNSGESKPAPTFSAAPTPTVSQTMVKDIPLESSLTVVSPLAEKPSGSWIFTAKGPPETNVYDFYTNWAKNNQWQVNQTAYLQLQSPNKLLQIETVPYENYQLVNFRFVSTANANLYPTVQKSVPAAPTDYSTDPSAEPSN